MRFWPAWSGAGRLASPGDGYQYLYVNSYGTAQTLTDVVTLGNLPGKT